MKIPRRAPRSVIVILAVLLACPVLALADPITVSGAPIRGSLPIMITAFANQAGTDVLPAGGTDYYVFTLFDTGSQRIYFDTDTATTLGVTNNMVTDVRINGLGAIDPFTLEAPIAAGAAQAEVGDVPVRLDPNSLARPDVTLVGGSVTNDVKAVIDYTTSVTRGPYAYLGGESVTGPDMTFYSASVTPPFLTSIELALQAFGATPDAGAGQRYWMYDVSFNEGAASFASPSSGDMNGTGTRFLYDTGTNVTIIRQPIATLLGLAGAADFTYAVAGLGLLDGYYLDSITMTGIGGTYTVLGAPVLVTSNMLGGSADAIIGSNLFWSSSLLFDGPGSTLSIAAPGGEGTVPEPASLLLVGTGLAGLRLWRRRRP